MNKLLIGSHVSMSSPKFMLGSVEEALSYNSTTFMLYTGAPQNTRRQELEKLKIDEAKSLMTENGIEQFIVHAPYIINLANTTKKETFELAVEFLQKEIERTIAMNGQVIVLHPGAHVGAGVEIGLEQIVKGLNLVLKNNPKIIIALETMAGKGTEIGRNFEEIKYIIDNVENNHCLGVCLDTCHIHDAGYDIVNDYEGVIAQFDKIIGLERLAVIHINDSKNEIGAGKDRHENIGKGYIGLETIQKIVNDSRFEKIAKILETPYIDGKAPYKEEINLLKGK
jgi:deoxyribonuclease-4